MTTTMLNTTMSTTPPPVVHSPGGCGALATTLGNNCSSGGTSSSGSATRYRRTATATASSSSSSEATSTTTTGTPPPIRRRSRTSAVTTVSVGLSVSYMFLLAAYSFWSEMTHLQQFLLHGGGGGGDGTLGTDGSLLAAGHKNKQQQNGPTIVPSPLATTTTTTTTSSMSMTTTTTTTTTTKTCTLDERNIIQQQLPDDDCRMYSTKPWHNKCSFSYATRCPNAEYWLGPEYRYNRHHDDDDSPTSTLTTMTSIGTDDHHKQRPRRTAIYVGCNKAMDAVNTLRMLSGNPRYDKIVWRNALLGEQPRQQNHGSTTSSNTTTTSASAAVRGVGPQKFEKGRCGQDNDDQFDLSYHNINNNSPGGGGGSSSSSTTTRTRTTPTRVHCIEAMPVTARKLQATAQQLQYDDSLIVVLAAMGNNMVVAEKNGIRTNRTVWFPNRNDDTIGVENLGIANCPQGRPSSSSSSNNNNNNPIDCVEVPLYGLDEYLQRYDTVLDDPVEPVVSKSTTTTAASTTSKEALRPGKTAAAAAVLVVSPVIDFLSIDVEGYDYEVLLGAPRTLQRTKYLEFEYNWKGPWGKYKLSQVIDQLQNQHGLWCYWAGTQGNLWRITDCWLPHYDYQFWSNVACVNVRLSAAAALAQQMEEQFQQTLAATNAIRYDTENTARTSGGRAVVVVDDTQQPVVH